MAAPSAPPTATPLFRALASSSTTRRRQAMASIRTYLSSGRSFTHTEYLKIWKALFYCLYMTPKMRLQQRLSVEISELVGVVAGAGEVRPRDDAAEAETDGEETEREEQAAAAASFTSAFWETMAREWSGIDKARLDKFLYLVRRMLYTSLLACRVDDESVDDDAEEVGDGEQQADAEDDDESADGSEPEAQYSWSAPALRSLASVLTAVPLEARDPQLPVGLRLHVLDVLIDEVERADPAAKMRPAEMEILLAPVRKLRKDSLTKTVRSRAEETLADERIVRWGVTQVKAGHANGTVAGELDGQEEADGGEEEWGGFDGD